MKGYAEKSSSLYSNLKMYTKVIDLLELVKQEYMYYFLQKSGYLDNELNIIIADKFCNLYAAEKLVTENLYSAIINLDNLSVEYTLDKGEFNNLSVEIVKTVKNVVDIFLGEMDVEITSFLTMEVCDSIIKNSILKMRTNIHKELNDILQDEDSIINEINSSVYNNIKMYEQKFWKMKKELYNISKEYNLCNIKYEQAIEKVILVKNKFSLITDGTRKNILMEILSGVLGEFFWNVEDYVLRPLDGTIQECKEKITRLLALDAICNGKNNIEAIWQGNGDKNSVEHITNMYKSTLLLEKKYLTLESKSTQMKLNVITEEIKYGFDSIFCNEIEEPIIYIQTEKDFESICDSIKLKLDLIVEGVIGNTLLNLKENYYESVISNLKYKYDDLRKKYSYLYMSKCNSGIYKKRNHDIYKIINGNELIKNVSKAYDINSLSKNNSNFEEISVKTIDELLRKRVYKDNDEIFERQFDELCKSHYSEVGSIQRQKQILYKNIILFKDKLWQLFYKEIISHFNYLALCIGENLNFVEDILANIE